MQKLIDAGPQIWDHARRVIELSPEEDVTARRTLVAPLPRPIRLRDVNLFLEHMEKGLALLGKTMSPQFKRQVIYYNADHLHVYGPNDDIPFPRQASWIDFELEWACVVGVTGVNISRASAADYIFGFCIFNDWSERGSQFPFMDANLGPGIGKDFANSLGPCIVTADEFPNPYALRMTAHVNDELWSSGTTSSMHWRFEDAIVALSVDRSLFAGEVLGSGTVLNGCGFELGRRLSYGDTVRLEVERIGTLQNRVVEAQRT
jgi:2-keto-4-pentenoate hydratase/2-oxohepta-3-ene-1,7-dioic acid hydratase in catechol pathway